MEGYNTFAGAKDVRHRLFILIVAVLMAPAVARARDKGVYQTTKLIELVNHGTSFCFVLQVDDLAYAAIAGGHLPSNLIVGDPVQVKIKGDSIYVKTGKKWMNDITHKETDDAVKARISVRGRVTVEGKLPTCSLSVVVR
jgi:hypothetical protein